MDAMKCNKDGWVKKKLGEVGTVITGSTPSTKDEENYSEADYNFVKPSDIDNHRLSIIDTTENYISKKAYLKSRRLPVGSVLTTCIGIVGKVGICTNECTCNQQINAIIPNRDINNKFLAYSILSKKYIINALANAPVVPIINKKDFSDILIEVPALPEQQRIVSELDCLNGIIEKQKEQLKQLDELAQSIFYDMFGDPVENEKGWKKVTLGSFSSFKNGINFKKVDVGNPVHFLSVSDFLDKKKIKDINEFSTVLVNEVIDDNFYLEDKDIIFVRSNGSKKLVGRSIIVYPGNYKVTYSGFCIRCRIRNNDVDYIGFLLSTPSLRSVIDNLGRGANIANLNQQLLGNLPIILPPLGLQQQFASKIEAIEHQKELIKKSIAETETLFNSRMDYYFG